MMIPFIPHHYNNMIPRNLVANTHAALNKLSRRRSVTNNLHRYRHRHRHQWMSVSTTLVTSSKTKSSFAAEELSSVGVKIYNLLDQGCLPYPKTWAYQLYLLNRRLEQKQRKCHQQQNFEEQKEPFVSPFYYDQDCVLILEHTSVYTLGRGADEAHLTFLNNYPEDDMKTSALQRLSKQSRGPGTARLTLDRRMEDQMKMMIKNSVYGSNSNKDETTVLRIIEKLTDSIFPVVAPNGVPVYRVERGGEVTYHGPKQLVVYPMLDLKNGASFKMDLHWYLRMIEEVIIKTLAYYNVEGKRDEINTGVWVNDRKIASVGICSSRWITTHGFALNVDPDLSYFNTSIIMPCGIEGKVTSLGEILISQGKSTPCLADVATVVIKAMEDVFGLTIQ